MDGRVGEYPLRGKEEWEQGEEFVEGRPLSRSREVPSFEILSPNLEGLRATKERASQPLDLRNWVSVHRYTLGGAHTAPVPVSHCPGTSPSLSP